MKPKVALINVKEDFTPVPPLGLLSIGTVLKENGYNVKVFDINIKESIKVIDEIKEFNPEFIGFSVMTTSYMITKRFNRKLKNELPNSYFFWGGVHTTALKERTLRENNLDFIIYGEGELTLLEICNKFNKKLNLKDIDGVCYIKENKFIENKPRELIENLDKLPIIDRSLLKNFRWYLSPPGMLRGKFCEGITTIYSSRGCPYQCIFCASKIIHGSNIRRRTVANVIKEINYLKEEYNIKGVYFMDDTFATDLDWLKEFCSKISGIIWGCQTRANIAQDFNILEIMKNAGCVQIDIGCESGSNKILKILKKGIDTDMIVKSFDNLKKLKIRTYASFILGNPEETMGDIKDTFKIAKKAPGGVTFLILVPYPGSELYSMSIENDWLIDKNIVFGERWTNKQSDRPLMEITLKSKELVRIRSKLQNKFFIKNNMLIILSFLKNPYYLYKILQIIIINPIFIYKSIIISFKRRKVMYLLEKLYQKFNEELRNV